MNLKLQTQNAKPVIRLYQLPNTITLQASGDTVMNTNVRINDVNPIQNTGINLCASGAAVYSWRTTITNANEIGGAGFRALSDSVGSSVIFAPSLMNTGNYTVTVEGRNCAGCPVVGTVNKTIRVTRLNRVNIYANGVLNPSDTVSYNICADSVMLVASVSPSANIKYWWAADNGLTKPGTNQCTINGDTVIARPLYSAEVQPATQYIVTAVDTLTGWFSMRTVKIVPNPKPVITANQQSYCAGDTIKLTAAGFGGGFGSFQWRNHTAYKPLTGNGGTLALVYGTDDYPSGSSDISVTAVNGGGCKLTALKHINLSPNLSVEYPKDTICIFS